MKLTLAVLALSSSTSANNERLYVNKDKFIDAPTPAWWDAKPAQDRADEYFKKTLPKFLKTWNLDADSAAWKPKTDKLELMRKKLMLVITNGCEKRTLQVTKSESRRRRSVLAGLLEREELGLERMKIAGVDLENDLNKMFQMMARYVVEEVLRGNNATNCQKLGYRLVSFLIFFAIQSTLTVTVLKKYIQLYRIERTRTASMWMYCNKMDWNKVDLQRANPKGHNAMYVENSLCDYNTEKNTPRRRINKNGEMAPHPMRNDEYKFFHWDASKLGSDWISEE